MSSQNITVNVVGKLQPPRVTQCGLDFLLSGERKIKKACQPGFAVEFLLMMSETLGFDFNIIHAHRYFIDLCVSPFLNKKLRNGHSI